MGFCFQLDYIFFSFPLESIIWQKKLYMSKLITLIAFYILIFHRYINKISKPSTTCSFMTKSMTTITSLTHEIVPSISTCCNFVPICITPITIALERMIILNYFIVPRRWISIHIVHIFLFRCSIITTQINLLSRSSLKYKFLPIYGRKYCLFFWPTWRAFSFIISQTCRFLWISLSIQHLKY